MGIALKYLRELLEKIGLELDRRTATSLLILLVLLILLPIGLFLIRSELTFFPKAVGELIQLGDGGCIKLNKDKKKVVDCTLVPLKLINPFYNAQGSTGSPTTNPSNPGASATQNPSQGASASPSSNPSPSQPAGAQIIRVSGNSSTQIQAALDQVKNSGGGVYLPAGTYTINKKVEVYSNVTLFGDGIDQTILDAGIEIDEGESVVGNSTSGGQTNVVIRDMTIRGHAQGSEAAIKLRNLNGGFVVNVKAERANSGILLGFHSGKGVNNVRISNCQVISTVLHGIFMSLGENNVIDNCTVNGNGSDSLGIGLEIGVTGKIANNWVVNNSVSNGGHSLTFTAGNDTQFDATWMNANNKVCYNTASGNHIQPIWDQRGTGNIYVGNNVNVNNVNSFGFEEKGGTDSRCDIPASLNIPAAPSKPSAFRNSPNIQSLSAYNILESLRKFFSKSFVDQAYALGLAPALNNSPYKDKLVSYWKFDEASGNSAADTNFQSNQGPGTAVNTTIVPGKFGKARMVSAGGQINIPNIPEYGDNVMSVAGWVKPSGFPAGASIWNQPEGTSLEYAPEGDGTLQCIIKPIRENQESTFSIKSSGKLIANQWNHVACTFDMATLNLYINGQQTASGAKSGWVNQPRTSQQVLVGKSISTGQSINGAVDDLAYWNRALTAQDVAAIYNNGQGQAIDLSPATSSDSDDDFTGTSGDDSDDVFTNASGSPTGSALPGGNGIVKYRLAESQAGLTLAQWRDFASAPSKVDLAFNFLSGLVGNVFAQTNSLTPPGGAISLPPANDSDDNFTGTSGDDSDDVFTNASGSSPVPSGSGGTTGPGSSGNPSFSLGKQFITTNFQLTDVKPGAKQIWVQYLHPDGTTRVDHVTFDLVDKVPQISGLACNLDISKQSLKITVDGNYFGTTTGKVTLVSPTGTAEILGWTNKLITASLKNPGIPINEGQRFQMKVVRTDGFESPTAVCAVDKSLVSLGAKIFCREPGKYDAADVDVTLLYNLDNKLSKVEEKVTINKDGEIDQLKTQLQVGKNYVISIKAPGSLRRNASFIASEGTTQITRPDGTPFILPVGDIAPKINVDGQINTLDRSELIRQWRILGTASDKQSGDFNRDTKVNSIDWACMQYDFGSSDETLPVEVPGSAANTIKIPEGASGTITIPQRSPTPRPSGQ